MKQIALIFGCVVLSSCGGEVVEEELPAGSAEQALAPRAVDLLGHGSVTSRVFAAAWRDKEGISGKAGSAALDPGLYSLHEDQVCGGQECPVADAPCEVHWYSVWHNAPVPLCACEHKGYRFPCR